MVYKRMTPLKASSGLNVSNPRFFSRLPISLNIKTPWQADTRYTFDTAAGNGFTTSCSYVFLDPLNIQRVVNADGAVQVGNRSWYSSDMLGLFALYQEGRYRTHVFNYDFVVDYNKQFQAGATAQAIGSVSDPSLEICVAAVPLSYLRTSVGAPHVIAEAGTLYAGVDYFSALSKEVGVRTHSISSDGSGRKASGSIVIDAFDHDGTSQSITASFTWAQTSNYPTTVYTMPDPPNRKVILIAARYKYLGLPGSLIHNLSLRAAYRLDQHMTFLDRVPSFPYVTAGVA